MRPVRIPIDAGRVLRDTLAFPNRSILHSLALALFVLSRALTLQAQAADFFWDNSAGTGRWNTADANWPGSKWVHSASNHAFFSTVGGSVSLRQAATTGSVLDRSSVKIDSFETAGSAFSVTLKAYSGHTYQLQRSQTLSGDWQDIGLPRAGDDAAATLTGPEGAGSSSMFYRVCVIP